MSAKAAAPVSRNFYFLRSCDDPRLLATAAEAEALFVSHPRPAIVLLRCFGEIVAQNFWVKNNLSKQIFHDKKQIGVIKTLQVQGFISDQDAQLLRHICEAGNWAAHPPREESRSFDAREIMIMAMTVGASLYRRYQNPAFITPDFVDPSSSTSVEDRLRQQLAEERGLRQAAQKSLAYADNRNAQHDARPRREQKGPNIFKLRRAGRRDKEARAYGDG